MIKKVIIFPALFFCMIPSFSYARLEATPSISVSELYDDNIDLEKTNKKIDWVTTVSPSINLNLVSENNSLLFSYAPTVVRYKNEEQYNTVRHSGTLSFSETLSKHLKFDLDDTYVRSEDPIEQTAGIYGIRQTRNAYQRNTGDGSISYLFGTEDTIKLGYHNSLLKNKDITLEDNIYSNPSTGLTYWFNIKNGIEFNYQRIFANFSRDDNNIPSDAYTGNNVDIKYNYRFNPHTTATLGYNLNTRVFNGATENYDVHEGTIGLTHAFSDKASFALSGGYFQLKNERSFDDKGYSYNVSLMNNFNRGNLTITGSGGWREGYQEAIRTGFIKYWGMDSRFNYQIMERWNNYARLSYMQNKEETGRKYKTYSGTYGWSISFLKWFSLSVDYSRANRHDDVSTYNYVDNRVMMTVAWSNLYK